MTLTSKTAVIIGDYRYSLSRTWDDRPSAVFCMLNPSTADAEHDDPTIRRCISFAKGFGYGSLRVINLFAWRSTDPRELAKVHDPVGPENDAWIEKEASTAGIIIAAWGANAAGERPAEVRRLLGKHGPVYCLGMTAKKAPRHPLYLPSLAPLMPYNEGVECA